jgi:hypothetical protein
MVDDGVPSSRVRGNQGVEKGNLRGPFGGLSVNPRGPSYERRVADRLRRREKQKRKGQVSLGVGGRLGQEGRSEEAKVEDVAVSDSLKKKWVAENELAAERANAACKKLKEGSTGVFEAERELDLMETRGKIRALQRKFAKFDREEEMGIPRKQDEARMALLEGQLAGRFALNPSARVLTYATTLKSGVGAGSDSSGSSGSTRSGGKTVWSGAESRVGTVVSGSSGCEGGRAGSGEHGVSALELFEEGKRTRVRELSQMRQEIMADTRIAEEKKKKLSFSPSLREQVVQSIVSANEVKLEKGCRRLTREELQAIQRKL